MSVRAMTMLILVTIGAPLSAQMSPEAPVVKKDLVPKDQAILEIELPKEATAKLDGVAVGAKRRFDFNDLKPGDLLRRELLVQFKEGGETKRGLLLKGGWHVRLVIDAPGTAKPEVVPQTGHSDFITSMVISDDGRWMATGSADTTAILWDVATGRQLRQYRSHTAAVTSVALSPDGKLLLTGSVDKSVVLHHVETGRVVRRHGGAAAAIHQVAFRPDGKQILIGVGDPGVEYLVAGPFATGQSIIILDVESGKFVRAMKTAFRRFCLTTDGERLITAGDKMETWSLAKGERLNATEVFKAVEIRVLKDALLYPDNSRILLGGEKEAVTWDLVGRKRGKKYGVTGDAMPLAFHPTKDLVLIGSLGVSDSEMTLFDSKSAKEVNNWPLWKIGTNANPVGRFTPDGKQVLFSEGRGANSISMYDVETGNLVRRFSGAAHAITGVVTGAKGSRIAARHDLYSASLWDVQAGQKLHSFPLENRTTGIAVSPDEQSLILTHYKSDYSAAALLYEAGSGRLIKTFPSAYGVVFEGVAFSPDGKKVALGEMTMGGASIWNVESGKRLRVLSLQGGIYRLAFTPDGKRILTGGWNVAGDSAGNVWDVETGEMLQSFPTVKNSEGIFLTPLAIACNSAGTQMLTASWQYGGYNDDKEVEERAVLYDVKTGKRIKDFKGRKSLVRSVAFTTDDRQILTAHSNGEAVAWDAVTGEVVMVFRGHTDKVNAIIALPDGRRICTGSSDGTVRIWDLATGEEQARLFHLSDGKDWLAITPEGLFDGSAGGRQLVGFRIGNGLKVDPVDRYFQDFYRPGLLDGSKSGERPRPDVDLAGGQPPTVRIVSPKQGGVVTSSSVELEVEVTDEGGGIQGPVFFHNGSKVLPKGKGERNGKLLKRTYEVTLTSGDNILEVRASTAGGAPDSDPARMTLRYEKPLDKPTIFVIAVGINRYAEETLNLKYAVPDAKAMAALFQSRGKTLYQDPQVETLLDQKATRTAIQDAIAATAKRARAQDTLVVFMAGHGTMVGQRYYFIPHEFHRSDATSLEDDVRKQGLPGDDLAELLSTVPALKRILIMDTCQSGGVIGIKRGGRNPFAFRGAIERLSRSTGVFAIAATSAGDEAKEIDDLGHGVLSYTLLAGLKAVNGGPLEDKPIRPASAEQIVDVLEWFGYATGQVPRLTRKYFGQEQDVQFSNEGKNFPLLPIGEK